jgi:BirA family biotin operon repressor/biotin-[acetyl-CoA-carboxylase] ligase
LRHAIVDSTNERALASVADGEAQHLDVHVAEGQTAGRGRRGRAWASAPGEGLYASVVLLPGSTPHPAVLTMGAGLGLLTAVHALGLARAGLDWPNDVVVDRAKLAGILVESRGLDPARPHFVVGIGLNVRQRSFPEELVRERAVTSLALHGVEAALDVALESVLRGLVPALETALGDPARTTRLYAAALGLLDRPVSVRSGRGEARGRLLGIGLTNGVEIELPDGSRAAIPLEHALALEPAGHRA